MSKRRTNARRVRRRNSHGSSSAVSVPRRGPLTRTSGIPPRFRARLGYNEQFTATPGAGSSDGYVIQLQSLYDPRFATGGHQPQFFDQLSALWTYFIVHKVKLRLTIAPDRDPIISGSQTNNVYQAAGLIVPFQSTTGTRASSAASDMLEWPGAVTRPCVTEGMPVTLELSIDLPKMLGLSWSLYKANPAFWGTNGGNPSTCMLYAWIGAVTQGSGSPLPSLCQATIEFDCEFFVPQTIATS